MEGRSKEFGATKTSAGGGPPPLHTVKPMGITIFYRMFCHSLCSCHFSSSLSPCENRAVAPHNLSLLLYNPQPCHSPTFDVLICTADPYREPPIGAVNTALSVMAYFESNHPCTSDLD
ncbi:hypothetical protein SADUNF_Sadunf03G0107800 [Salix dunnii]|uniref:Uncharacterized protein n=1 Tax=Salix dunnii TaxID=1413687 RepID=A0A835KHS4_9ROSI|nr:hypothetical protein SADUNF_Sadunf03G0107800 [Salix dunnii]